MKRKSCKIVLPAVLCAALLGGVRPRGRCAGPGRSAAVRNRNACGDRSAAADCAAHHGPRTVP